MCGEAWGGQGSVGCVCFTGDKYLEVKRRVLVTIQPAMIKPVFQSLLCKGPQHVASLNDPVMKLCSVRLRHVMNSPLLTLTSATLSGSLLLAVGEKDERPG